MGLERYVAKRDFGVTPEPKGRVHKSDPSRLLFIVQKHAATRLHYDFRLEHDGVLLSWAVPKGPSFDPAVKRLAVRTEDHPMEYAEFEGVIPRGEYGGGTVLLWDRGCWFPDGDVQQGLQKGHLKFRVEGEKLHGAFELIRTGKPDADGKEQWLLRKKTDEHAIASGDKDVTERSPDSVATRRTMDEIARARDRVWSSRGGEQTGAVKAKRRPVRADVPGAKKRGALPDFVAPQLATLVGDAPTGEGWLHEPKYDGYRVIARVDGDDVRLLTRNAQDWTDRYPAIARALRALPAKQAMLDGEACVFGDDGRTDFAAMQNVESVDPARLTYVAFDLLFLDGVDLRGATLLDRKRVLAKLLQGAPPAIRFGDHVETDGVRFHREACRLRLEGIISKRADEPYESGRGRGWLKVKCQKRQEFVIGGFTAPSGSRKRFGALLLGAYEGDRLVYAGKVGTGFTSDLLDDVHAKLAPLVRKTSPFVGKLAAAERRGATFVEPKLVAEIEFTDFTADGRVRHPSFKGLRDDKAAKVVVRELEQPADVGVVVRGVRVSSPDRVVDASTGLTKAALVRYYDEIAPKMLPFLKGRALAIVRCPEGTGAPCFFQKAPGLHKGAQASSVTLGPADDYKPQLAVATEKDLIALVQNGALEIHPWGSRADLLEKPDVMVIDLDPDESISFSRVVEAAHAVRGLLDELGLESFVKSTGGKGLHVVVPMKRTHGWDDVKAFTRGIATTAATAAPQRFTATITKESRVGKIYIDFLRNARGATAVAPWSTRAKPGAKVAVPLFWEELDDLEAPPVFHVDDALKRAKKRKDPWARYFEVQGENTLTADALRRVGATARGAAARGRRRPSR